MEWIDIENEVPANGASVIALIEKKEGYVACSGEYWRNSGFVLDDDYDTSNITHWVLFDIP